MDLLDSLMNRLGTVGGTIRKNWAKFIMCVLALSVVIFIIVQAYQAATKPSFDLEIVTRGNFTRGISADDPRWPKLEKRLDDCNVKLNGTEDTESISFFEEASSAAPVDMSDAMNRYLYFAIMHAVVLRRPFSAAAVGQKVGRGEVKKYLDRMLETMQKEEITAKDAPTEFKEMNRYLYLTIVQGGVLQSKFPAPLPSFRKEDVIDPARKEDVTNPARKEEDVTNPARNEEDVTNKNPDDEKKTEDLQIDVVNTELENTKKEVVDLNTKVGKKNKELEDANNQNTGLKERIDELEKQLRDAKDENEKLTNDLATWKNNAEDCSKKLNLCQARKENHRPLSDPHGTGDDEDDY